jgi:siderophore synthetase component
MPLPREVLNEPEERVIRQLVEGALFEGLIVPKERRDSDLIHFEWNAESETLCASGKRTGFNRIRLEPKSIVRVSDGGRASLQDVIGSLPAQEARKAIMISELDSTVAFSRWNAENLEPVLRRTMSFSDLDCAIDEGHPYHPAYRTRSGFSCEDHQAYAPECGKSFQLSWFFIHRSLMHMALPVAELAFWQEELGDKTLAQINEAREALKLDLDDFTLLPMHPWQWSYLKGNAAFDWVERGLLLSLGELGDYYRASQSLRSLINVSRPSSSIVKLPLSVVNTSSKRLLEPHSVCSAPILSNWLYEIVRDDHRLETTYPLAILREFAGVIADRDGAFAGEIGAIWREHPDLYLKTGEAAVPFNALMMLEMDGRPFIAPWVDTYGLKTWVARLVEVAVLPVWHLLVCHGIATEAHGQNMILVHENGWPVRLILRDFHESVEFSSSFLGDPTREPDLKSHNPIYEGAASGEFYWLDNLDGLRELAMDTLFVFNLAEVSHLLEEVYGYSEAAFFEKVAHLIECYGRREAMSERQAQLGWRRPFIKTESLITRKLLGGAGEYHHVVANALAISIPSEGQEHD